MKPLPLAETYERELMYMPYRDSLREVEDTVVHRAPRFGTVVDYMCGPGYLLGRIAEKRKDLTLFGFDVDERYIDWARTAYPGINFAVKDLTKPEDMLDRRMFDVTLCTGALHHLPYHEQPFFVERMRRMTKSTGFAIISDCYVDDYSTEEERKLAAAKLGYEYLRATIQNGAPDDVVAATADIIHNDVMMAEFKTSFRRRLPIFERHFRGVQTVKTWPKDGGLEGYGDYVTVLRN